MYIKSNFFVKRLVFKEEKVLNVCNREGLSQEGRESYKDERDFLFWWGCCGSLRRHKGGSLEMGEQGKLDVGHGFEKGKPAVVGCW